MNDGKILHFFKNFPPQYLLAGLFIYVLWLYLRTSDQFLQRIIDTLLGGLLGVVIGRGTTQAQSANTNSGDINLVPKEGLQDLTTPEAIGAVEIKEEK